MDLVRRKGVYWQLYKECVSRGLWFVGIVIHAEDLYPLAIVKVSVAICEGAIEELVDLDQGEWRGRTSVERHLLLIHAFSDIAHPLSEFVDLDCASVCLVERLERLCEICLWVELDETFAHHCEEHGKVYACICGE